VNLGEVNGIFEWCGLGALRLGFECFLLKVDGGKGVDGSKVLLDLKIGEVGCRDLESRL
jgi:hypothetical protein